MFPYPMFPWTNVSLDQCFLGPRSLDLQLQWPYLASASSAIRRQCHCINSCNATLARQPLPGSGPMSTPSKIGCHALAAGALGLGLLGIAGVAHAAELDNLKLTWPWALPFAGLLLSIATGPLLAPKLWHAHYGKVAFMW